jgi:hypothetical protein
MEQDQLKSFQGVKELLHATPNQYVLLSWFSRSASAIFSRPENRSEIEESL